MPRVRRDFLTPEEVADVLGVTRRTVYSYIKDGRLYASKVGPRKWAVLPSEVSRFVRGGAVPAATKPKQRFPVREAVQLQIPETVVKSPQAFNNVQPQKAAKVAPGAAFPGLLSSLTAAKPQSQGNRAQRRASELYDTAVVNGVVVKRTS